MTLHTIIPFHFPPQLYGHPLQLYGHPPQLYGHPPQLYGHPIYRVGQNKVARSFVNHNVHEQ